MQADIAVRALRDHRRSLGAWALGIAFYIALIVVFWPSIRDSAQLTEALADYPDAVKQFFGGEASFDFSTAAGYLNAELFSLMVPLLLSVFAIGYGASTLAGEEEHGLLDLVLSLPVTRSRVVREKAAALGVDVVALGVVGAVTILAVGLVVDLDAGAGNVLAACAGAVLVALLSGYVALFVGAWRGSRAVAIGVASAFFAGTYLLQVLANLVDALEPARWISPLYLANGNIPIRSGWPVVEDLILAGVVLALVPLSAAAFTRRDLGQ